MKGNWAGICDMSKPVYHTTGTGKKSLKIRLCTFPHAEATTHIAASIAEKLSAG